MTTKAERQVAAAAKAEEKAKEAAPAAPESEIGLDTFDKDTVLTAAIRGALVQEVIGEYDGMAAQAATLASQMVMLYQGITLKEADKLVAKAEKAWQTANNNQPLADDYRTRKSVIRSAKRYDEKAFEACVGYTQANEIYKLARKAKADKRKADEASQLLAAMESDSGEMSEEVANGMLLQFRKAIIDRTGELPLPVNVDFWRSEPLTLLCSVFEARAEVARSVVRGDDPTVQQGHVETEQTALSALAGVVADFVEAGTAEDQEAEKETAQA